VASAADTRPNVNAASREGESFFMGEDENNLLGILMGSIISVSTEQNSIPLGLPIQVVGFD
jgi:hypothetical protein